MIRIFDTNNEMTNHVVKPILRKIISKYSINVDLGDKNTQALGKDVIAEMNKRLLMLNSQSD
jgi:hypothetical protein